MDEPGMCDCCGRGPFVRMQSHLSRCDVAKRRSRESTTAFRELAGQGWKPTGEPQWKQRRFDHETVRSTPSPCVGRECSQRCRQQHEDLQLEALNDPSQIDNGGVHEDLANVSHDGLSRRAHLKLAVVTGRRTGEPVPPGTGLPHPGRRFRHWSRGEHSDRGIHSKRILQSSTAQWTYCSPYLEGHRVKTRTSNRAHSTTSKPPPNSPCYPSRLRNLSWRAKHLWAFTDLQRHSFLHPRSTKCRRLHLILQTPHDASGAKDNWGHHLPLPKSFILPFRPPLLDVGSNQVTTRSRLHPGVIDSGRFRDRRPQGGEPEQN